MDYLAFCLQQHIKRALNFDLPESACKKTSVLLTALYEKCCLLNLVDQENTDYVAAYTSILFSNFMQNFMRQAEDKTQQQKGPETPKTMMQYLVGTYLIVMKLVCDVNIKDLNGLFADRLKMPVIKFNRMEAHILTTLNWELHVPDETINKIAAVVPLVESKVQKNKSKKRTADALNTQPPAKRRKSPAQQYPDLD